MVLSSSMGKEKFQWKGKVGVYELGGNGKCEMDIELLKQTKVDRVISIM
jgi:hypothetical protein